MSKFKGTPGPWKYTEVLGACKVSGGNREMLAYRHSPDSENRANARLIAAAPELLEALENLMTRVQYDKDAKHWFTDEQKAARSAIAKARGEKDE